MGQSARTCLLGGCHHRTIGGARGRGPGAPEILEADPAGRRRPGGLLTPLRTRPRGGQAQLATRQGGRRARRPRSRTLRDTPENTLTAADFDDVRTVTTADVYKGGRLAGHLRRHRDGVEFAYRLDYVESGGPAVATTLPVSNEAVQTHGGAVPPYFAGLLPEGRRLSSLRRAVKASADDELSLLLAVGHDCIGDVQVVADGTEPSHPIPLLEVRRAWSEVRFREVLAEGGVIDPVALPGVQDKVSARMITVPVARAGERYLLKIDPPEYPHVAENESFFLELARRSGIPAAAAEVVHDADRRPGLLVRRFDRVARPLGATQALACEDACQALGRWPADKYLLSYEQVVTGLADCCQARPVAARAFYRQICFAWLTGNGDVHAKNLSILATPEGEWRASPAYDLPATVPYGDKTLALRLGGRTSGLSRRHLLDFAGAVGLAETVAAKTIDELVNHLADLETQLRAGVLPFTKRVISDLVAELRYRRRQATG